MRLKDLIARARSPRVAHNPGPTAVVEPSRRDIALVIAEPELAAMVSELYRASGYEVFVPETTVDVIETLAAVGNQVRAVVISPGAVWASGVRKLIADEFPRIGQVTLVS